MRIPDEYLFINKIDDVVRTVNDLLKNEKKYQQRIDAVKDKLFEK